MSADHDSYSAGSQINFEVWIDTDCGADRITGPCGRGRSQSFHLTKQQHSTSIVFVDHDSSSRIKPVDMFYSLHNQIDQPDLSQHALCTLDIGNGELCSCISQSCLLPCSETFLMQVIVPSMILKLILTSYFRVMDWMREFQL